MPTHSRYFAWLIRHALVTFALMTVAFVVFGVLSLDLVKYVAANASFLLEYGVLALLDGGFLQFAELWFEALLALAAYLVFKLCEQALLQRMINAQYSRRDSAGGEQRD